MKWRKSSGIQATIMMFNGTIGEAIKRSEDNELYNDLKCHDFGAKMRVTIPNGSSLRPNPGKHG